MGTPAPTQAKQVTAIPEQAAKQIAEQLEDERVAVAAGQAAQATTLRLLRAVAGAMAIADGWRIIRQPDGSLAFEVPAKASPEMVDYQAGHEGGKK